MASLPSATVPAALFAACLLSAATGAAAASSPPAHSELAVLQTIKVGLDPAGIVLSSWQPTRPCSTWLGLLCDNHGHVTSINFGPSVIFTGALHSDIGSLPFLATLVVRTDGFVKGSTIPASMSKLSNLTTLVLSGFDRTAVVSVGFPYNGINAVGAGLSGSLPAGIATLPALTYLDLSNNLLTGPLPSFAGAEKLLHLDLSGNNYVIFTIPGTYENPGTYDSPGFEGPASTFSASNALTFLNLASNNFSTAGTLSVLTKLEYLNLGANNLTAFDGADITSHSLTYLNLSTNSLQGALPDLAHVKSLQSLDLSNILGLTGTLRADYGTLTNLRLLNLSQPYYTLSSQDLQGPIPAAYGALSNLRALSISCPFFNGSVDAAFPLSLGKLQNLQSLTINGAQLYGVEPGLPAFVGNLTGLRELNAYYFGGLGSEAMGAFPSNLANLQSLTSLTLRGGVPGTIYSYFSGSLPQFVLSLKSLQKLDLSSNNFSGPVWPNLGESTKLTYIDLSMNALSGTLADVLSAGPSWRHVDLDDSGLGGPLPATIGSLNKSLQYLSLPTSVNGTWPASISQLTALQFLEAFGTTLTGGVPDLSATNLTQLFLDENQFTDSFPKLPATLKILSATNNHFDAIPDHFTGLDELLFVDLSSAPAPGIPALPPSLFGLPKLQILLAFSLKLKAIPTDIGGAIALQYLDLSQNNIAQPFPAGIQSLQKLQILNLYSNNLTGVVPDLSALPLSTLGLHHNMLTGPLPRLGPLGNPLVAPTGYGLVINLSYNNFTSVSSAYIANLTELAYLDISYNQLSGPLPDIPATLRPELFLDFSHNAFSGTPPPDYFNRPSLASVDVSSNQLSGPIPNIWDFSGEYPYDTDGQYPGNVADNYFTGRPVTVNTSSGISSCMITVESDIVDIRNNCLTFSGTDCGYVVPQRTAAECAAFCGDTSASGPCAGHGVCSLNGSVPTCACDPGYTTAPNNSATCMRGTGYHPPNQGHHPPGQGHHPPGQGHHPPGQGHHPPGLGHHLPVAVRRLM